MPQGLIVAILVGACTWFGGVVVETWKGHGETQQQLTDSKSCRDSLIDFRNREQACRDEMHRRDIDDLRARLAPLEHPKR